MPVVRIFVIRVTFVVVPAVPDMVIIVIALVVITMDVDQIHRVKVVMGVDLDTAHQPGRTQDHDDAKTKAASCNPN